MIENVSTQLTVFHCFAHCLLPGRAFASLYVLLFLEKEAEIGGRGLQKTDFNEPVMDLGQVERKPGLYYMRTKLQRSACTTMQSDNHTCCQLTKLK